MSVDRVMVDLGLVVSDEESPGVDGVLYAEAMEFLTAGGQLGWALWRGMTPRTRAAFVRAGESIESRRIAAVIGSLAEAVGKIGEVSSVGSALDDTMRRMP